VQLSIRNSKVTLNRAQGGGSLGGVNGQGYGGGIGHFGALDLLFTDVSGNSASTGFDDIF
jgi:hypothetical protein